MNSALSEETPTVEGALEKTIFFPALWNQRLSSVTNLLGHFGVSKVLDLGCGEGKLATYLKHNENIEEVRGVDLEENTLFLAASLTYPLVGDYLFPRSSPLTVSFYKGDLLTPHPSLLDFDSAVCIEVFVYPFPYIFIFNLYFKEERSVFEKRITNKGWDGNKYYIG